MLHKKTNNWYPLYRSSDLSVDTLCSDLLQGLHELAETFGSATPMLSESAMCSQRTEGYLVGYASLLLATQALPLRSIYCWSTGPKSQRHGCADCTPLHSTPWPGAEKTQQETNGCHNIIYHRCSLHLGTWSTHATPPGLAQGWALRFGCITSKCSPQATIEHYIMERPCKHKEMFCNMLLELTQSKAVVWKPYLKDKSKR